MMLPNNIDHQICTDYDFISGFVKRKNCGFYQNSFSRITFCIEEVERKDVGTVVFASPWHVLGSTWWPEKVNLKFDLRWRQTFDLGRSCHISIDASWWHKHIRGIATKFQLAWRIPFGGTDSVSQNHLPRSLISPTISPTSFWKYWKV